MLRRRLIWLVPLGLLIVTATARATPATSEAGAEARAYAIKISVYGQGVVGTPEASAPPDASVPSAAFSYPADGSIVRIQSTSASANATSTGGAASGMASSELNGIQIFGEISISHLRASAMTAAMPEEANGNTNETVVEGATYLGQPISIGAGGRVQLGDWGYIQALTKSSSGGDPGTKGRHETMRALDLHLVADHGGLPAGSEIVIGWAYAFAQSETVTSTVTIPKPQHTTPGTTTKTTSTTPGKNHKPKGGKVNQIPPDLKPKLTRKGRVFPVYGQAWYSDSFNAPRADTGWHHGIDIFAPMGTPLLAVADGTVFSVGWNNLGGNRLWLRDKDGNTYYYAHLSAFSPLALNGLHVKAGAVLGFVGNSGDAISTPPHVHFEAHPADLLPYGYDGSAVDPYSWLVGLEHLHDVAFPEGTASWAKQIAAGVSTQQPGAVLLHSTDISALPRINSRSLASLLNSTRARVRD
ncbi:MAG: peptidoglycan DD-metalloendopeptidase family protein [Gaiellaceae bacterium]